MRLRLCLLIALLPVLASCGWQPPLSKQQVITQDAYQSAPNTVRRVADHFVPVSAAALAAQQGRPLTTAQAWLLLDDGAAMQAPAAGYAGKRSQLAAVLAQRMLATLSAPASPDANAPPGITAQRLNTSAIAADATLQSAIAHLDPLLTQPRENSALIIFSRADRVNQGAVRAAAGLRQRHPGLCLHLVSVGDPHACFKLRSFGACGSAVRGADIAEAEAMAEYVRQLFYGDPADSDGDGIQDYRDQCPDTPRQERINWDGCPFDRPALDALLQRQHKTGGGQERRSAHTQGDAK
jgi:hypothetical protein